MVVYLHSTRWTKNVSLIPSMIIEINISSFDTESFEFFQPC